MNKKLINILIFKDIIYLMLDNNYNYNTVTKFYCDVNNNPYIPLDTNYITTRVLYRDIYNFNDEITIYKGLNYDLKENMAVIDNSGIVGFITKVNKTTSEVRLISHSDINLSVKVNDSYGLLKNIDNKLVITNLTNTDILVGTSVYTSGLANLNEGIKIGNISYNIDNIKYEVNISSNLDNINYLYIIKDVK